MNLKNKAKSMVILAILILAIFFLGKAQTNIINIVFFSLNVFNAMMIARADNKKITFESSLIIATIIKYFAIVVIIAEFLFACTIGLRENKDMGSTDQLIK